jgi:tetratricopeptide (TPR) repeat protein
MTATCVRALAVPLVLFGSAAVAQAPPRVLMGQLYSVESGEQAKQTLPRITVTLGEFGLNDVTNDTGYFRIALPAGVVPGREVTLEHDKKDYAICSPLFGKQIIPSDLGRAIVVQMLPSGSKLFWDNDRIEEFIARTGSESARKLPPKPGETTDLSAYILELGQHYGFTPDEIRARIGAWMEVARKDATDFRRRGLAAFAEQHFRLAGENFRRSAEAKEKEAAESLRASASDRELAGDAFNQAHEFRQALREYQNAVVNLDNYKRGLEQKTIELYPEYAVDLQRITVKSVNARIGIARRVGGAESRHYLDEALELVSRLTAEIQRSSDPVRWAEAQVGLAGVLELRGSRQAGPDGLSSLKEAISAFQRALEVQNRADHPKDWAAIQNDLGLVLKGLSERQEPAEGLSSLIEAIAAYRRSLTVATRADQPLDWARTQNNLGNALGGLASRQAGPEGLLNLKEAIERYDSALSVLTREVHPEEWATAQQNRGNVLELLAARQPGPEGLKSLNDAVAAHEQALTVRSRDGLPQNWAKTQTNLGRALTALGHRQGCPEGLKNWDGAVAACRLALSVYTPDDLPREWAWSQRVLGDALQALGRCQDGADGLMRLNEAIAAYRLALTVQTREALPQEWAMTQNNLGFAFQTLGDRPRGTEGLKCLDDAVAAYRLALSVHTRDGLPDDWALTQANLAEALQGIIIVGGFPAGLRAIDRLSRAAELKDDPPAQAALATLEVFCRFATGQDAEARRSLAALIARVERQDDEFHLVWDWSRLRGHLAKLDSPPVPARRQALFTLLGAVGPERKKADILTGLKKASDALKN